MTKFILLLEARTENKQAWKMTFFGLKQGQDLENEGFSSSRFRVVNNAKNGHGLPLFTHQGETAIAEIEAEIQLLFFFGILFCSIPSFSFLLYNSYNLLQRIHNYISYSVQHIRQKRESDCPRFELDNAILMVRDFILARARRHALCQVITDFKNLTR